MTASSVNTSVFILTALVAAGLAGYYWMQPSGKYSTTSDGATCPFSTASEEEKKKGGKCPVTGAVVRATSPTQTHSTSPPPQSPIKAVRSPPPVPNTPPSSPQTPLPSSPQKASPTKKSPSNSPKQVTFKAQTASEENVTRENPQMSSPNKQPPHSPIQTAPKTVPFEHLLVQETSQDLAHTMVEALVHKSVVQVADEMAEKEDYVQVEMTQSTENIASCGTWKTPVIEPHVVEEEDGVNVSPPSSESDEPIANPVSLTKPMSPPKPVSRKNVEAALPPMSPPRSVSSTCDSPSKPSSFVYEEKKMPKTPPPSPVKTVVEASPAKRVASPPLSAHVDLPTNAVEDEPVCAVVDTEVVRAEAEVDTGDAPDEEATEADAPDAGAIEADTLEEDAIVDTSGAPKSKSKKKKGKKRR